jgi:hypothetical protein
MSDPREYEKFHRFISYCAELIPINIGAWRPEPGKGLGVDNGLERK